MTNNTQPREAWEEEYEKIFREAWNDYFSPEGETPPRVVVKDFIRQLLQQAREEEREKVEREHVHEYPTVMSCPNHPHKDMRFCCFPDGNAITRLLDNERHRHNPDIPGDDCDICKWAQELSRQSTLEEVEKTVEGMKTNFLEGKKHMCWKCSYWGKDCKCDGNIVLSDLLAKLKGLKEK